MLEDETIVLETETPQEYWEDWSSYAAMLYERNGYGFFVENGPMAARYAMLTQNATEAPVLSVSD